MSTTPAPANRKPTGGGAGAAIASAVRRTGCDTAEAGTLPRAPLISVAATVMAAGGVTDGANVSTTITVNDAVRVFPCASRAVHVTVVAPSGNVDPLAGAHVGVIGPSSVS